METFYRYEDYRTTYGTELRLLEFKMVKETPRGYWIRQCFGEYICGDMKRWIRKESHKKYACPTKEQALKSFKARKHRQHSILRHRLEGVECAIGICNSELRKLGVIINEKTQFSSQGTLFLHEMS